MEFSFTSEIPEDEKQKYQTIPSWVDYVKPNEVFKNNLPNSLFNVFFENMIIESHVFFFNTTFNFSIVFKNCFFKGIVNFRNSTFNKSVIFENCCIDNHLIFECCTFKEQVLILSTNVNNEVNITSVTYSTGVFNLQSCRKLYIVESNFSKLDFAFSNTNVEQVFIHKLDNSFKGELNIKGVNAKILEVIVSIAASQITLTLSDFSIKRISLNDLRIEGKLKLSNLKPVADYNNAEFSIQNCYLGKAEFYLIDFSEFYSIDIIDSQILDSTFMNVNWNSHSLQSFNRNGGNTKEYYTKQRETFRQLKYAFGKQGDIVNEQVFHGFEMTSFNKSLPYSNNSVGVKLIILLSRMTSNYGQSISRPFVSLIIGHLCLFSILMLTGFYLPLHLDLRNATVRDTWLGISHYLETINPLRKYDFPSNYILLDLLMRIWASYMIYNFIRASRRFIK